MTYLDAYGRPELVMDLDISRGAAAYRIVPAPDDAARKDGTEEAGKPRREPSPVRAAAATQMRDERDSSR